MTERKRRKSRAASASRPARSEAKPSKDRTGGRAKTSGRAARSEASRRARSEAKPSEGRTGLPSEDQQVSARAWLDGRVIPLDEARIPLNDHGLLYGDGIFEGIRIVGGRVFRLDDHLARFAVAARAIGLALPGGIAAVRAAVLETARAFAQPEAYVRLVCTRGVGALGVDPTACHAPRLFCIVDHIRLYDERQRREGLDLVTVSVRRPSADVLDPRVKSLNYLNNVLAKREARLRGADEALVLNTQGNIAEAAVANLFCVRDGALLTPPATDGALEGITRRTVLELARELAIPAEERTLGRFDLFACAEAFLTGSGAGLVPVRSLDGERIGGAGEVFGSIQRAFERAAPALGVPFH